MHRSLVIAHMYVIISMYLWFYMMQKCSGRLYRGQEFIAGAMSMSQHGDDAATCYHISMCIATCYYVIAATNTRLPTLGLLHQSDSTLITQQ